MYTQSIIVRAPARPPRHLFFFRVRAAMRGGVAVKIKYGMERGVPCRLSRAQRSIILGLCETLARVNASCLAAGQE
jgi:hypothetical protein